jgi:hypothetical protein
LGLKFQLSADIADTTTIVLQPEPVPAGCRIRDPHLAHVCLGSEDEREMRFMQAQRSG